MGVRLAPTECSRQYLQYRWWKSNLSFAGKPRPISRAFCVPTSNRECPSCNGVLNERSLSTSFSLLYRNSVKTLDLVAKACLSTSAAPQSVCVCAQDLNEAQLWLRGLQRLLELASQGVNLESLTGVKARPALRACPDA